MDNPKVLSWSISPYLNEPELYSLYFRFDKKSLQCFEGRNRNVFELAYCVVKLPKNQDGYTDNDWEGSVSNSPQTYNSIRHIQYPRKRLIYVSNIPVLFMEKIIPIDWEHEKQADYPVWLAQVDCAQVGYTKEGRLVAYDYGPR